MRRRCTRRGTGAGQRGFAMIAILALVALMSAYLIANALNATGSGLEREQRSMNALREAKAALIAYAANEQWQLYKGQATDQPGALPCPDILGDDGVADCVGPGIGSNTSLIGRLPWASIGGSDLRDASGERLWYALSYNFRKDFGNTIINSDTPGQLAVVGTAPASNVVAVLFAPGEPILAQNRPSDPSDPAHNSPASYLEDFNLGDPVNFVFTSNPRPSGSFNDRVIVITQAELMAAVEPVVAARIERDVKPLLQAYFGKWGAYPFAVPFDAGPPVTQPAYQGASTQTVGMLPVTTDTSFYKWASATVTTLKFQGMGIYDTTPATISPDPTDCTISSSPLQAVCQVNFFGDGGSDDRPNIRVDITLQNKDKALADIPTPFLQPWNLTLVDGNGNTFGNSSPYGSWSSVGSFLPTSSFSTQTGVLTYIGRLRNADSSANRFTITIPLPAANYLPGLTGAGLAWFISNRWYRQTFYAVSDGFKPGGSGVCNPAMAPFCLTVNSLPPSYATLNDKRAILLLAGRSLSAALRPNGTLADYLEGANLTAMNGTTPFVYEHRSGVAVAINDRVVVVAP